MTDNRSIAEYKAEKDSGQAGMTKNLKVCIGIPCYSNVSPETLEDYMRFAFHIGRRLPQYDICLAIKSKSEQFRARNGIVDAAQQQGCDYMLMIDDDHVIEYEFSQNPTEKYSFIDKFIKHLQNDPKLKIVGALYYHRGGECAPVILKQGKDGGYYYIRDDEVEGRLQEVAVTGGGCMMIDMKLFDFIPRPYFQIENKYGTDIQLCQLARDHGFKVACDTSIVMGHVLSRRMVVTPKNRLQVQLESQNAITTVRQQIEPGWVSHSALQLYKADAMEYAGWKTWEEIRELAADYQESRELIESYPTLEEYYRTRGPQQLARQVFFHFTDNQIKAYDSYSQLIDVGKKGYGLDFGCGSAPLSFDYMMRGQRMDFVDIDGSHAYEFTKWRAKHRGLEDLCGWQIKGQYDYIFLMDVIEHLKDWKGILDNLFNRLRNGGALITNYFFNADFSNPEHINMDHEAVKKFIVEHGIYPINLVAWIKKDWGMPE